MRRWGIRMDGCGERLEILLTHHLAAHQPEVYTLVEVGSAGCISLRSFHDILTERRAAPVRVVGLDLTESKAWSLDWKDIEQSFAGLPRQVYHDEDLPADLTSMSLLLLDDPRPYLRHHFPYSIDFAFIDGCHGACAGHDFEAIEAKVSVGGLVVFHDAGELETGTDWQRHCQEFINVRTYIKRLGLMDNTRLGWRWVGEVPGSRQWGGDGNSAAVVQRVAAV